MILLFTFSIAVFCSIELPQVEGLQKFFQYSKILKKLEPAFLIVKV